jgi:hypothetical protein
MTSEGLVEMFEGYSADTRAGKFPLVSMGAERRLLIYFSHKFNSYLVIGSLLLVT